MQNWADEIRKWLGAERMRALVLQPGAEAKQQVLSVPRPFFACRHVMHTLDIAP